MSRNWRKMASEGITKRLKQVIESVEGATARRSKDLPQIHPRLVAVSKTKPNHNILAAYRSGQRHFGENYIKELEEKSQSDILLEHCPEIRWHFIGHIQGNKAKKLATLPNLYMVETVDSRKVADTLNNCWEKFQCPGSLLVMVQVNTSQEDNKSGCNPEDVPRLVTYIRDKCPCLKFKGLMTIGAMGYDPSQGPNPDFLCLVKCREDLCKALNLSLEEVELSMGMSTDFEHAIELGSTNVRVGSTIFGARDYPPKMTNSGDNRPGTDKNTSNEPQLSNSGASSDTTSSSEPVTNNEDRFLEPSEGASVTNSLGGLALQ